jgi:hypothetical protein
MGGFELKEQTMWTIRKVATAAAMAVAVMAGMMPVAMAADDAKTAQLVPVKKKPLVQIAILLDTSNSMDGLIEQAKTQLWKVVNEFAKAQRDGVRPEIQVALYQYGTPSLGRETGYIKQLVPLSTDLDKVSEELFKLRTNGGDEYCGAVIKKAAEELAWSKEKGVYKAIFIAGNEPFTQGDVPFEESCKEAISSGIIVNTIYCGEEQAGIREKWKDGAALADGSYMSINQNAPVVHIDAPQDKELAELSASINKTYIAYGKAGQEGLQRQAAQDANAQSVGAAAPASVAQRSLSKANGTYRNATWDLVDAVKEKQVVLKDVKDEDLPEEMKKLDEKGREAYVQEKLAEREKIQAKILELNGERDKYIAAQRKESAGEKTLDKAMVDTVRSQANRAGMAFEGK